MTIYQHLFLRFFMSDHQIRSVANNKTLFPPTRIQSMIERIQQMPKAYESEGQGDHAIVYLRYHLGDSEWFILERDQLPGSQLQCFCFAVLDGDHLCAELGYSCLEDLIASGALLDMNWQPKTLGALTAKASSERNDVVIN